MHAFMYIDKSLYFLYTQCYHTVEVSSLCDNVPKKNKLGEVNFLDVVKNRVNYTACITFRAESYNQSGCVNVMLWSRGVLEPEERAALWSGGSGHSI